MLLPLSRCRRFITPLVYARRHADADIDIFC